jgi:hypothetical protein
MYCHVLISDLLCGRFLPRSHRSQIIFGIGISYSLQLIPHCGKSFYKLTRMSALHGKVPTETSAMPPYFKCA